MATAVAKGAYYTWDSANFAWDATQSVHAWDDMAPLVYTRDDAEAFSLRDGMTSAAGKVARDAVQLADTRRWADLLGTKREQVGVHETYWDYINYILTILESARVIESSYRGMDVPKREGVKITRRSHSEIMESPREQLGILDASLRAAFAKLTAERTEVTDARDAAVAHLSRDKVAVGDGWAVSLGKMTAEQLGILDASLRAAAFKRTWSESASLGDDEDNHVVAGKFETIRTSEHRAADVYKPTAEQIGTTERQYHRAQTFRTFMEKASLYEHMRRDLGGGYSEAVAVDDRFLRALDGIIEEVAVRKGGMTADEFQQLVNQPTGYERFIPYIVGEYEYQKALVRLAVTPGSLGAEPAVYNVVVHVDIDDTVDRGTAVITDTSAATMVRFAKHYYTKPEVTVTLRGGNTADGTILPNVAEISKDKDGYYFMVELLKADGTRAKGTVTWQSVGY
ncbi:hypothetical protein [Mitsuokella jalaludinii]|uniref:hypothetical protein n=1 Tax=Mitsuokella jalaludinii TaxID=187979 RepID=UPI0020D0683E|nr:hypothetical protein [Mitsuokella jalaludinii]MCQ1533579.1 hypothetical protein [Mitsuokella jalaludinii]